VSDAKKNLPVRPEPPADPAAALQRLLDDFGPAALAKVDEMARAFKIAEGVKQVRALVRSVADKITPLQGSALGFRTDKDRDGGYPADVVAECATEALLRGLRLTGNEWNIIGGRCYVAQAGCARLLAELPGLTDLEHAPGVPALKDGGALVEYTLRWKLDGRPMSLTRVIPVRVNSGQGVDAIVGKAKRKILAAAYERVTGSALSDGDTEDPPLLPPAASKPAQLAERMRANAAPASKAEPAPADDGIGEPDGSLFGDRAQGLPD
jgi:hypothetical protein